MEARPLYTLYCVTPNVPYTSLHVGRPTYDRQLLEDLIDIVQVVRPGRGQYYDLYISQVTEDWAPTAPAWTEIKRIQKSL